jgi:tRNA pseudouridine38-40 synthase
MNTQRMHEHVSSRRLRLRLEFDGSRFCGWQLQSEEHENQKSSLQGCIERALKIYWRVPERVVVQGCGRTDAGVSAREFFMHVDVPKGALSMTDLSPLSLERMRHSLNGILEEGVSVTHCESVPSHFHALRDVTAKIYEYTLFVRRAKPTLEARRVYWIPEFFEKLDIESMGKALKCFEGEHDISSFAASDHGLENTIRKIFWTQMQIELLDSSGDFSHGMLMRLFFCGDGFLKHQVRTMVGTLVEVAMGKREWTSVPELLSNPAPRAHAGFCAPAHALLLRRVFYGECPARPILHYGACE